MDDQADLGVLIRSAHGLDRAWWDQAKCKQWEPSEHPALGPWRDQRYVGPSIWQVDWSQRIEWEGRSVPGRALIELAVLVCQGCPAQWDCATYAVRGLMCGGTWAMTPKNLQWLIASENPLAVIDSARESGTPVEVAVRAARSNADVSSAA